MRGRERGRSGACGIPLTAVVGAARRPGGERAEREQCRARGKVTHTVPGGRSALTSVGCRVPRRLVGGFVAGPRRPEVTGRESGRPRLPRPRDVPGRTSRQRDRSSRFLRDRARERPAPRDSERSIARKPVACVTWHFVVCAAVTVSSCARGRLSSPRASRRYRRISPKISPAGFPPARCGSRSGVIEQVRDFFYGLYTRPCAWRASERRRAGWREARVSKRESTEVWSPVTHSRETNCRCSALTSLTVAAVN